MGIRQWDGGSRRGCLRALAHGALALWAPGLVRAAAPPSDPPAGATKTSGPPPRPRPNDSGPAYGPHARARELAAELDQRHGIERRWSLRALSQARRVEAVRRLIMPPPVGVPKNWQAYRDRFVEPVRIDAGLAFWRAHADWLERAEAQYGVPPEIVVAIVGVETFYGRIVGRFRVIDALATLAFDFPPGRKDRSDFFRDELAQFLRWCHREGLDPLEPRGSYAGAIGLPQFMPSSILKYGIDYDGDGHVDLRTSGADVVGSVAHYLAEFGWQRGLPTHHAVRPPVDTVNRALLLAQDIVPSFTAAQFVERGAELDEAGAQHEGLLALVELENGGAEPTYVAGSANFYVITRYNWSSYYAMAVIALAEAVKSAR